LRAGGEILAPSFWFGGHKRQGQTLLEMAILSSSVYRYA
jgi:hypothetical protein